MFGSDIYDTLTELSESEDTFCQEEKIICSTPIKFKERRSFSLIDVSSFDSEELSAKKKLTTSTDTIGTTCSQSSVCKDSGYIHSESNTSLNSTTTKEQKRLSELIEDLKFKNVLISELQKSNHTLRLKYAEAENRISELRLKCESHCDCCNLKNSGQNQINVNKNILTNFSTDKILTEDNSQFTSNLNNLNSEVKDSYNILVTNDDSFSKVKRWQENIGSCSTESCTSLVNCVQRTNNRPQILNTSSTILSKRIIGDRAIRISPLTNIKKVTSSSVETRQDSETAKTPTKDVTLMIENLQNLIIGDGDLPVINYGDNVVPTSSFYNKNYPQINLIGEENKLTVQGSRVSIKSEVNGKVGSIKFKDRKLEMERTIREGMSCLAEKGKNEPCLRYRPWEKPRLITNENPYQNKTKPYEISL